MFFRRTGNVLCLELIPAELGSSADTVSDVKADRNTVFLKDTMFASRTKKGCKLWLIPVELFPTPCESVVETPEFPCEHVCEDPTVSLSICLRCWEDIPPAEIYEMMELNLLSFNKSRKDLMMSKQAANEFSSRRRLSLEEQRMLDVLNSYLLNLKLPWKLLSLFLEIYLEFPCSKQMDAVPFLFLVKCSLDCFFGVRQLKRSWR